MASLIDQPVVVMPVPGLLTLGVLGQVCAPYRKVGVDYSKRTHIEATDEPWERPITLDSVYAYLAERGLDAVVNEVSFLHIVPTQRLGENLQPRMAHGCIVGVQATIQSFYAYLDYNGKKNKIQAQKLNLTWWFEQPNDPPSLCENKLKLVHLSDEDLVPRRALWAASVPAVRKLIETHGG